MMFIALFVIIKSSQPNPKLSSILQIPWLMSCKVKYRHDLNQQHDICYNKPRSSSSDCPVGSTCRSEREINLLANAQSRVCIP